ncbi:MAG: hypothetical protein GF307_04150 [candidate division Zixibacteria bacterium]|nr:hypothetical protein [candidate division Zixibacteria bacterium]
MINRLLKSFLIIFLIAGFSVSAEALAKQNKWRGVKPEGTPEYLRFGKKGQKLRYYKISENKTLKFVIYGPSTAKVWTRLGLNKTEKGDIYYTVVVKEKGEIVDDHVTKTHMSSMRFDSELVYPGVKRTFTFKVPKGKHTYEIGLTDARGHDAYIRVYKERKKKKVKRVLIQPREYKEVLSTVISERLSKYYLAEKDKPVEIEVIGPTKLKGYARLNFDATMKGKEKYAFEIFEDQKFLKEIKGITTKSDYHYRNKTDVIPSIAKIFYLDVPDGKHKYTFRITNGTRAGMSFKLLMPEKDLTNKE